ncbi:hypothetical protein AMJ40_05585 [candidate division TA06 bacterium DG_26]|uniref:Uncharacterized protein n=1 Tax=candidate division TA06 bacterium DG_26 TaxID=1703771 RepID=A0A0S7WH39_UNCT6|nr:MAG: hypothetical protein AMJ40_05585 [candidate division TA06 bacterium DG_26]
MKVEKDDDVKAEKESLPRLYLGTILRILSSVEREGLLTTSISTFPLTPDSGKTKMSVLDRANPGGIVSQTELRAPAQFVTRWAIGGRWETEKWYRP